MKLVRPNLKSQSGFTFIEILVAIAIFVLAVIAAVNVASGSVHAVQDSKDISMATWLLQSKMVELETKLENQGFDKGCEESANGTFDEPNEKYSWSSICQEIDFYLSETAAQLASATGEEEDSNNTQTDQITKLVLQTASQYITNSTRELHVEIKWNQFGNERTVSATTHFARYDQKVSIPGIGTLGTGNNPGTSTDEDSN